MAPPDPEPAASVWTWSEEPLLGTRVAVRISGSDEAAAAALADEVFAECDRLERVFSVFDETSALRRWCRGELDDDAAPPELHEVLVAARSWERRSGGAFSTGSAPLSELWRQAEREGRAPSTQAIDDTLAALLDPPYDAVGGRARRLHTPCRVDLNAIAKGYIVDCAAARWDRSSGAASGVHALVVNAGGDLLHRGRGTVPVGIEDPERRHDNGAPLTTITLGDAALATSGPTRRGFRVGGRWFGHVLDPRTGRPTDGVRSASVLAPDAMTADAVATVVSVLPPPDALAFVEDLDGVAALAVDDTGRWWRSSRWPGA
ncbi:MAG: FAD:protein FMN transferase [Acidimicrobiales bacterium]